MTVVDDAAAFLTGPGRSHASRMVARHRLPADAVDDLVQEALIAVVRADALGRTIDNVEAFVSAVVRRRAVDLVRGERRRPWCPPVVDPADEPLDAGPDPVDTLVAVDTADGLRAGVVARLAAAPFAAAGALAVLAAADPTDPATPSNDCPQPAGGASASEALAWVGLFYAGRRGWWSPDPDPAERQRRSRWSRAQAAVLADVAHEAGVAGSEP